MSIMRFMNIGSKNSGEWTPCSVIVLRRCSKENPNAHGTVTSVSSHLAIDSKHNSPEYGSRESAGGQVERGHREGPAVACNNGISIRRGIIDEDQPKAMIHDGAKLADDVLALPVCG